MTDNDPSAVNTTGRRLTDSEFAEIRELYELGAADIVDLAEKYGVSRQTLSRRFKDAGVTKGSRAHEIASAAGKAVKSASAATAERFSDKRPDFIEETQQQGYQILKQAKMIGQKLVADAIKTGKPIETLEGDMKALGRYVKLQTELLTASLTLLKADEYRDEEGLPALQVEDLTMQDVLAVMQNNGMDATEDDINAEGLADVAP